MQAVSRNVHAATFVRPRAWNGYVLRTFTAFSAIYLRRTKSGSRFDHVSASHRPPPSASLPFAPLVMHQPLSTFCRPGLLLAAAMVFAACSGTQTGPPTTTTSSPPVEADGEAYRAFIAAQLRLADGDTEGALDELRIAVRRQPDVAILHLRLANLLLAERESDDADRHYQQAHDLGVPSWEIALERAGVHSRLDEPDEALAAFESADATGGSVDFFVTWFNLARDEDAQIALDIAWRFASEHPEVPRAQRYIALAQWDLEAYQNSADAFREAALMPGGSAWDAEQWVAALIEAGETQAALDASETCITRYRESILCYAHTAVLADRLSQDGELDARSLENTERLARITSGNRRSISEAGAILNQTDRDPLINAYIDAVVNLRPNNVSSLMAAAWVAHWNDDADKAIEVMERVLAVDEANFDALNYIGYEWAERGIELERAEVYIREALFLRPGDANIMDSLAWCYYRMERFEEALEVQLEAVEGAPNNAILLDHLGDIQYALGLFEDAIGSWESALEFADEFDEDVIETVPLKLEDARAIVRS